MKTNIFLFCLLFFVSCSISTKADSVERQKEKDLQVQHSVLDRLLLSIDTMAIDIMTTDTIYNIQEEPIIRHKTQKIRGKKETKTEEQKLIRDTIYIYKDIVKEQKTKKEIGTKAPFGSYIWIYILCVVLGLIIGLKIRI